MGVRGLSTFVQSNSDQFMVKHELHSTTVIIDANNLVHYLHNSCSGLNAAFGGDYDKIFAHFSAFCTLLDSCKISPIMVFDGGLDLGNRKKKTRQKRIAYRVKAALSCNPRIHGRLEIFPLFCREVFMEACKRHKFSVVQCDYEADDEMASLSRTMNCPVISNDSDFVIFGIPLIPLQTLDFSATILTKDGKEICALPCKMFMIDNFLRKFGSLPKTHLPLLGILLGNDYVSADTFQALWSSISIPKDNRMSDMHRKLKAMMLWLQKVNFDLAVQKIVETVRPDKRENVKSLIQRNLLVYSQQPKLIESILNGSEVETEILSFLNNTLPQWFVTAYRKHEFPCWLLEITCGHFIRYLPQVECRSQPYAADAAIGLLRGLVALLLTVDYPGIKLDEIGENVVELEFSTRERGRTFNTVLSFSQGEVEDVPSLVNLPDIELSARLRFFDRVLCISVLDADIIERFPDSMKLFVYALIYWARNSKPEVEHFDSLILMMVMFDCVAKKIGRVRSKEKTKRLLLSNSEKSPRIHNTYDINELWTSVSKEDCLRLNEEILELYQLDQKTMDSKKFEKEIVHSFAEFQMTFFLALILNRLLRYPCPESEMFVEYNGLFAYNSVGFMSSSKDWLNDLERRCKAPTMFLLLRAILSAFQPVRDTLTRKSVLKKSRRKKKLPKKEEEESIGSSESSEELPEEDESVELLGNRFAALLEVR